MGDQSQANRIATHSLSAFTRRHDFFFFFADRGCKHSTMCLDRLIWL